MPDTYWFSHPFIQEEKPNVHSKHAGSDKALPLIEEPQSPWTWFTRVPSSGSKSVSHSPFLWATLCTDKCNSYQEASHVPSTVYFGSGPVSASIIKWGWWDDSSPERDQRKLHDLPRFLFFALHCLACLHFFFFFINRRSKFNPHPGPTGELRNSIKFQTSTFIIIASLPARASSLPIRHYQQLLHYPHTGWQMLTPPSCCPREP